MDLKRIMFLKASGAQGEPSSWTMEYEYKLNSSCQWATGDIMRYLNIDNDAQGRYAGGYGASEADAIIRNRTNDGNTYYPIMLNGATKLYFDVPSPIKVTVFFGSTQTKNYSWCGLISGDANAYDSSVAVGPREVNVPEGADCFIFSLYYPKNIMTAEIAGSTVITASK